MRGYGESKLMWGITVVVLLWFVEPIGAIPLESWDSKIPNAGTRFKVLSEFNGEAVLDKETQLVWEQAPSIATSNWVQAHFDCANKSVSNRKGWRLPSMPELTSLADTSVVFPGPTLPPGHPFLNVQGSSLSIYWSASTVPGVLDVAWGVQMGSGFANIYGKLDAWYVWCVRGGMNAD